MDAKLYEEMDDLLDHEIGLLKRKFSDHRNDDPLSIMRDLVGKDPIKIFTDIYEACIQYFSPYHRPKVNDFIQTTLSNKLLRHMFLLAIYKGAYSADKLFPKFFEGSNSSQSYGGEVVGSRAQSYHREGLRKTEGIVTFCFTFCCFASTFSK